jgi:UDP-N-acetylmuramate--alanine ligase
VREILPQVTRPVRTYAIDAQSGADLWVSGLRQQGMLMHFNVHRNEHAEVLPVTLNLPGRHNVLNALAAIAVASELGIGDAAIQSALKNFAGIGRRFQVYGECATPAGRVLLIDDYGHHPRELAAVIDAIRNGWPDRRLVLAFQPHRYTRTRDLFEDFTQVLSEVDALVLAEVYPAGEQPIAGADGRALSRAIRLRGQVDPVFVSAAAELPEVLVGVLADGDVLLLAGAGDIGAVSADLATLWPAAMEEL